MKANILREHLLQACEGIYEGIYEGILGIKTYKPTYTYMNDTAPLLDELLQGKFLFNK